MPLYASPDCCLPLAQQIVLGQDNLNSYTDAVFYPHLPAAQARALAARFEGHYTPNSASWLNMVELELSAIARQCLHQRILPWKNSPPT